MLLTVMSMYGSVLFCATQEKARQELTRQCIAFVSQTKQEGCPLYLKYTADATSVHEWYVYRPYRPTQKHSGLKNTFLCILQG